MMVANAAQSPPTKPTQGSTASILPLAFLDIKILSF